MRAAVRDRYGPPDVVQIRDIDRPVPTGDQVLVRVEAASVNRADLDLLLPKPGFTRLFMGLRAPRDRQLGCDLAGVVEAVGPDVTRFKVGDRVYGDMYPHGLGSFAEAKVASETAFRRIPATMSTRDAATLPHAAILAVQALRRRNGRTVSPGEHVLVDGGSGSVGPFAIQAAKALGAEVTATCSAAKVDFVRSLGADHVIDYRTTDVTRAGQRYDWIIDVESHHSMLAWRRALRPRGVYVTLGGAGSRIVAALLLGPILTRVTDHTMGLLLWWAPFGASDVATIAELHEDGRLRPAIDRTYALDDIVEALRYVDSGQARGKVLIEP